MGRRRQQNFETLFLACFCKTFKFLYLNAWLSWVEKRDRNVQFAEPNLVTLQQLQILDISNCFPGCDGGEKRHVYVLRVMCLGVGVCLASSSDQPRNRSELCCLSFFPGERETVMLN